jgi:hypothetical protein
MDQGRKQGRSQKSFDIGPEGCHTSEELRLPESTLALKIMYCNTNTLGGAGSIQCKDD